MAKRVNESNIGMAVLQLLKTKSTGEADIDELKKMIPSYLDLSDIDRAQSKTRPNEEMWEQQVRNLVSHRTTEGNIIAEGLAEYVQKTHSIRLTEAGRHHLMHKGLV